MCEVILFGGTTEGRLLAEALSQAGMQTLVCVATDYGESLLAPDEHLAVHSGRLDASEMQHLLCRESPYLVIDATHPYAEQVSRNIRAVCEASGTEYLRVSRERAQSADCYKFTMMDELIAWLEKQSGSVFSTLGAKEAPALSKLRDYKERVWLRILPSVGGLSECLAAGFPAGHIICMQGPFSEELNRAMFHASGASILITKESGTPGGFAGKAAAAKKLGMKIALLVRPYEVGGVSLDELMKRIKDGTL